MIASVPYRVSGRRHRRDTVRYLTGPPRRCADAAVLGQELRRQDQRNKTVLRRRTSIFTAALELKKLRAQGGALHYRVWDPESGVDALFATLFEEGLQFAAALF